jgi:hypothetical protein
VFVALLSQSIRSLHRYVIADVLAAARIASKDCALNQVVDVALGARNRDLGKFRPLLRCKLALESIQISVQHGLLPVRERLAGISRPEVGFA